MREKLQAEMSRILTAEAKGTWLLHLLRTAASLQSDRNLNCARVGGLNNSLTLGAPPTTLVTRTSVLDVPASDVLDQATARSGPEPRFLHPKPMLDKVQPPRIFSAARHAQTPDDDEKLVTPPPRLPARTPIYPSYPPAPRLCPSGASNYSPTQAHHIDAGRRHPRTPPWTSSLIVSQADVWESIGQATSSHLHFVAMGDIPGVIYAIAILFSLLAIAATVLRFYARSIKKVGISWDDYAIIPALV
ncbi:MAG: hypothetical protein LQ348_007381 [Seirophora lacunosa]|nr:MAG: hypothetical protein LQ348_007381 [Seirophora lacunosa]